MKNAIYITSLLFNEMKKNLIYLTTIIYKFNEQNFLNNEELNIKLLLKSLIETFKEKSNIESTKIFIIKISNLLY